MKTKVATILVASTVLFGCSEPTDNQKVIDTEPAKAEHEIVNHGVWEDQMEGTKTYYSYLTSVNGANFDFPYKQNTKARLFITSDNMLEIRLDSGQVMCTSVEIEGCWIKIKFDDSKPTEVRAYGFGNGKYNGAFFCPTRSSPCSSKSLINKIKSSKKMLVEIEVYNQGYPVFEFDTSVYEDHPSNQNI